MIRKFTEEEEELEDDTEQKDKNNNQIEQNDSNEEYQNDQNDNEEAEEEDQGEEYQNNEKEDNEQLDSLAKKLNAIEQNNTLPKKNTKNENKHQSYKEFKEQKIKEKNNQNNINEEDNENQEENEENDEEEAENNEEPDDEEEAENMVQPEELDQIEEAEIEEDKKPCKKNKHIKINDEYNKVFDEILKKKGSELVFKKGNNDEVKQNNLAPYEEENISTNKGISFNKNNNKYHYTKNPNEFSLYADAYKRKEKMKKMEDNNLMNIIISATKTKISKNSHKIAIAKTEKMIDEAINKYEEDKCLSFNSFGEVLTELKIFREIFNNKNKTIPVKDNNSSKIYHNYKDIQIEMISSNTKDERKQQEYTFYEQFWLIVNPGNKEKIKSDLIGEILKILFAPISSSSKETSEILKNFLMTAFFLNSNPNEVKKNISPITGQEVPVNEIWNVEKLVKEFKNLKQNLLAYQTVKNPGRDTIKEAKSNKLTFKPTINPYKKDKTNFFTDRVPSLLERANLRKQVLQDMKKEENESEMIECSFKPTINKYIPKASNRKKEEESKTVFQKLYDNRKVQENKLKNLSDKVHKQEDKAYKASCTFKPKLNNEDYYKNYNQEKPKGYDKFIMKMRYGILKSKEKKFLEEKIPVGENYEKVKQEKIEPFNITDLNKKEEISSYKNKEFFTVQAKLPSGKETTIKVYLDEDPYTVAENFCKIYNLKEEIQKRLSKMILEFKAIYLKKAKENNKFSEKIKDKRNVNSNNINESLNENSQSN